MNDILDECWKNDHKQWMEERQKMIIYTWKKKEITEGRIKKITFKRKKKGNTIYVSYKMNIKRIYGREEKYKGNQYTGLILKEWYKKKNIQRKRMNNRRKKTESWEIEIKRMYTRKGLKKKR